MPRTGQYGEAVLSAVGMGMVMVSCLIIFFRLRNFVCVGYMLTLVWFI